MRIKDSMTVIVPIYLNRNQVCNMVSTLANAKFNLMYWVALIRFLLAACVISMATVLSGCATMALPDYPMRPPSEYELSSTQNGFCIGIHAITDKDELQRYFGKDLSQVDIVPIHLTAKNNHPNSSFLLSRDAISLRTSNLAEGSEQIGKTGGLIDTSNAEAIVQGSGVAALVVMPIGIAMVFQGVKQISDGHVIQLNMAAKELYTKTLSPGKSCDGFVYFKLPEKDRTSEGIRLNLSVKELFSKASYTFSFPLK